MTKFRFCIYLNWLTVINAFQNYPLRLVRILLHLFQWIPSLGENHLPSKGIATWTIDFGFYIADLFFIPDVSELIYVWLRSNIRLLNDKEKLYAGKYFGNKVNLKNIRISDHIPSRIKKIAIAFVTFNTIHYSKTISLPIFIHEMVHIWQYQKFGSVYIFRAFQAQRSKEGYNYGGLENLYSKMLNNYIFTDFNFEQQSEIFEDYCKMIESRQQEHPIAEASFAYFIKQVRDSDVV